MLALRSTSFSRCRVAWLLSLALVMPVAQTVALLHSLSHVQVATNDAAIQPAVHADHCGICLSAQTVMGGATLVASVVAAAIRVPADIPQLHIARANNLLTTSAYQSRAPPAVLN